MARQGSSGLSWICCCQVSQLQEAAELNADLAAEFLFDHQYGQAGQQMVDKVVLLLTLDQLAAADTAKGRHGC